MDQAEILSLRLISSRVRQNTVSRLMAWLLLLASMPAWSALEPTALDQLPAAERYRQLNLILMVSEGIEPAFLQRLLDHPSGDQGTRPTAETFPAIEVDNFQTPLNRIVEQDAMISSVARVFQYALDNHAGITQTLEELATSDPAAVAQVDLIQLAEDAIIVRTAITGSLEYQSSHGMSGSAENGDPAMPGYLDSYRNRTVYLRNVMEFWQFEVELAAITDSAMVDTGGRMDAYQRMLEDQTDLDSFKQHLQAVENIYWQTRHRKGKPPSIPSDELIEAESKVN